MTIHDTSADILKSLKMQIGLVHKKMENLEQMEKALQNTTQILEETNQIALDRYSEPDSSDRLRKRCWWAVQKRGKPNIRISLHEQYSQNKKGWFPWLLEQMDFDGARRILEIGCGNGQLWKKAEPSVLKGKYICLSDLSDGMIRDAAENLGEKRHPVLISGHWTARSFRFRMRNTTGLLQIMFCSMSRICPAVCRKSAVCFQMTACSTAVRMEKAI